MSFDCVCLRRIPHATCVMRCPASPCAPSVPQVPPQHTISACGVRIPTTSIDPSQQDPLRQLQLLLANAGANATLRLRSHDRAPINSLKLRQPGARCGRTLCRARHDPSGPRDEAARSSPRRPLGPAVRSRNAHALALARDRRGAPGPVRAVGCGRKDLLRDHRLARQQRRRSGGAALRWLRRAAQRSGGRQGSVCGAVVRRLGCRARKSPDGTGPWSG